MEIPGPNNHIGAVFHTVEPLSEAAPWYRHDVPPVGQVHPPRRRRRAPPPTLHQRGHQAVRDGRRHRQRAADGDQGSGRQVRLGPQGFIRHDAAEGMRDDDLWTMLTDGVSDEFPDRQPSWRCRRGQIGLHFAAERDHEQAGQRPVMPGYPVGRLAGLRRPRSLGDLRDRLQLADPMPRADFGLPVSGRPRR